MVEKIIEKNGKANVQSVKITLQQRLPQNTPKQQPKPQDTSKPQIQNNNKTQTQQQKPSQNNQKPQQTQNKPQQNQQNGKKWVYTFSEGKKEMKALLGGKGANLAEMTTIGLPVPPGFTITTEVCDYFYKNNKVYPKELQQQINTAITWLEGKTGMKFGDTKNPLLVSVRSGAAASMPGMMDTILNLGLNDISLQAMILATKNERFCLDSYRRFIQMFGDVVMGVEHHLFMEALDKAKQTKGVEFDTDLDSNDPSINF